MDSPVAIVTGAGSGIGRSVAMLLSRGGYLVVLVGRRRGALEAVAAGLPGASRIEPTDIGDARAARAMAARVADALGRVDVLVNNAGLAPLVPIVSTDDATLEAVFRVNALGPAALISELWPVFERRGSGCIVNISSIGSRDPFPGFFAYGASKAALNTMTRSCATEGAAIGVRAFCIAPGAVETPMLRGLFSIDQIPPTACLKPEDVARVALECVEGQRDADNGSVIWLPGPPAG
jgi:NAD(P)-dependent dehydrogenase (short-subunit alcohol dehydrogenase family)